MDDEATEVWEEFALDDTPLVPLFPFEADTPLDPIRRAATNSDWPPAPPQPQRAAARRARVFARVVSDDELDS